MEMVIDDLIVCKKKGFPTHVFAKQKGESLFMFEDSNMLDKSFMLVTGVM